MSVWLDLQGKKENDVRMREVVDKGQLNQLWVLKEPKLLPLNINIDHGIFRPQSTSDKYLQEIDVNVVIERDIRSSPDSITKQKLSS